MADNNVQNPQEVPAPQQAPQQVSTPAQSATIDYDKLASIINGKQAVAEDTVLKNYFKNQGLSQTDAEAAIAAFKEEKAKKTPDVTAIQQQLDAANKALLTAHIEQQATTEALGLGINHSMIPYVIKLADMSAAVGSDGKINADEIKKAISKVLEDVPAFKGRISTPNEQDKYGGFSIGTGGGAASGTSQEDMLRNIFGVKTKK
ncbi:MAG: hypothetical protein ACI4EV_02095 [Lachnospiraceae bacterium]